MSLLPHRLRNIEAKQNVVDVDPQNRMNPPGGDANAVPLNDERRDSARAREGICAMMI
jgi:hypothetical protein